MPKPAAFSYWGIYTRLDYFPYQFLHCFGYVQMLQITKLQKLTLISFKSFIRLYITNDGRLRYSLVFPKAKKGDHAIRKIKTQASRGGYDVDGALEDRGCTLLLMD